MMSWIVNASPVKWQTPTLDMSTARLAKLKLYRWPHHSRPNGSASEMRSKPRLSLRGRTLIAIRRRLLHFRDRRNTLLTPVVEGALYLQVVSVTHAMKEIREKSPTIKAQLDAGTVGLVGAIYDVSTGKVVT